MKSYRLVDDQAEPVEQVIPRHGRSRQVRPLSRETIEAIASYAERHEIGSLNETASAADVAKLTTVRSL